MSGCYYDTPYNPELASCVVLSDSRQTGYVEYLPNILANSTVEINGESYLIPYKVVSDEEILTVTWNTPKGVTVGEDKYAIGGTPIYRGSDIVENDKVSSAVIFFENLPESLTADATFTATAERLIPGFEINHTLTLYTNLYYNIKIKRIQNTVDVMTYVTEIKLDGKVIFTIDATDNAFILNDGGTPDDPSDDEYRITLEIRPERLATDTTLL